MKSLIKNFSLLRITLSAAIMLLINVSAFSQTFTPAIGYVPSQPSTLTISNNIVSFNGVPINNYNIVPVVGNTYAIGRVSSDCTPTSDRSFTSYTNYTTLVTVHFPSGVVTIEILSLNSPPYDYLGTPITGSYTL
jgi:hypothetical protein